MTRLDIKLSLGVTIIIFGLLINIYMPLNFYLNRYLNTIHEFDCNNYFIYVGAFPGGERKEITLYRYAFRLEIGKKCNGRYLVNATLFLLSGGKFQYDKTNISKPFKADNISVVFNNFLLVDEDEEFISLFFPDPNIIQNNSHYILFHEEPFAVYAKPNSIGYVNHYIALPREVAEEEFPIIANGSLPPLLYMFYRVGKRLILYNAVLKNMSFIESLFPQISFNTTDTGIFETGFIDLVYTNTVPANQDWLYAIRYEFGIRLYPLPLVLIVTGIILIVIRFRQGR